MDDLLNKEIGGYFELDIDEKYDNIKDFITLNSARNCLRYVICAYNIKKIHIPYYICPVVWQAIKKENCEINFYHIDMNFMPICDFNEDDFILYVNYYGVCAKNVEYLAKKYKNLIVDNAHAFYMPRFGIASFNSLRKFFGVSDGALLDCDKKTDKAFEQDTSFQRFSHLLERVDKGAKFGFDSFCKNDNSLNDESIKIMSNLTKKIFNSIDINNAKEKRLENYFYLNEKLSLTNELKIELNKNDVPMVYPYLIRNENIRYELIKNNIFIEQYWTPNEQGTVEGIMQKYLLPLPIDQRYNKNDMEKIVNIIVEDI